MSALRYLIRMTEAAAPSPLGGYSVIVPAHDEEDTIVELLRGFGPDFAGPQRQVMVICNASTDRTAERAASVDPNIEIVEVSEAGKWRAINEGLTRCVHSIVLIVDADISISGTALDALALELRDPEVHAVAPGVQFDLSRVSALVGAYYRVFATHPYLRDSIGGAGVYGMSAAGIAQVAPLPRIISDDGFVRARIAARHQRRVTTDADGTPVQSVVRPPRSIRSLLRSEARWRRGDWELRSLGHLRVSAQREHWSRRGHWTVGSMADTFIYFMVKALGRLLALFQPVRPNREWQLDRGSRA